MSQRPRKFLVVVDRSPECRVAVRYAARRALHTEGRVSLLCVSDLADYQQWAGVGELMRDEARAEAEKLVWQAARHINEQTGIVSEIILAEGQIKKVLFDLIRTDKDISILVLAASSDKEGPGPLVGLVGLALQPIPVTIVPGNLTDAEVDALS
ncbi:MAG: universal stress protein [Rhizomicrobium sp.]